MSKLIDAGAAKLADLQIDLLQKIRNDRVSLDHLEWFLGLTKAERDARCAGAEAPPEQQEAPILRLISEGADIILPETAPGKKFSVYEMTRDATYAQMFGSLTKEPWNLALTTAQRQEFCEHHRNWLRKDGYVTFFLFEEKGDLFVNYVSLDGGGMVRDRRDPFEYGPIVGSPRHRVVVPQLVTP